MKKRMMLQSNKKSKKGSQPEKATKKGQKRKLEDKPECSKDEERKRKEKEAKKKQKATNQNIISQRVEGLLKKMSSVAEERFSAASDDDLVHSCADILRPALPYHQRSPPPLPRLPEACINPSLRPNYVPPQQPIKKLAPKFRNLVPGAKTPSSRPSVGMKCPRRTNGSSIKVAAITDTSSSDEEDASVKEKCQRCEKLKIQNDALREKLREVLENKGIYMHSFHLVPCGLCKTCYQMCMKNI